MQLCPTLSLPLMPRFTLIAATIVTLSMFSLTPFAMGDLIIAFNDEAGGTRLDISGSLNTPGLTFVGGPVATSFFTMQDNIDFRLAAAPGSFNIFSHGITVSDWHALGGFFASPVSEVSG